VENIPGPLLDRMEVIRLVGYITDEKTHIARGYLEKAAREGSGVTADQVIMSLYLKLYFCIILNPVAGNVMTHSMDISGSVILLR
jgi:hypothetical protein